MPLFQCFALPLQCFTALSPHRDAKKPIASVSPLHLQQVPPSAIEEGGELLSVARPLLSHRIPFVTPIFYAAFWGPQTGIGTWLLGGHHGITGQSWEFIYAFPACLPDKGEERLKPFDGAACWALRYLLSHKYDDRVRRAGSSKAFAQLKSKVTSGYLETLQRICAWPVEALFREELYSGYQLDVFSSVASLLLWLVTYGGRSLPQREQTIIDNWAPHPDEATAKHVGKGWTMGNMVMGITVCSGMGQFRAISYRDTSYSVPRVKADKYCSVHVTLPTLNSAMSAPLTQLLYMCSSREAAWYMREYTRSLFVLPSIAIDSTLNQASITQ
ncbi:hypothetical protein DFP73DRAFT_529905 [Morchella snyderi]|nr:hypothetical protein DFP73DRAFT_529905 [Morchella snyderi]